MRDLVRKTWLPTLLFLVIAATWWWVFLGIEDAWWQGIPIVVVAPPIWWAIVARANPGGMIRGALAGALIGVVSQLMPHVVYLGPFVFQRGQGDGDAQLAAWAEGMVYLALVLGGFVAGALIGVSRLRCRSTRTNLRETDRVEASN